MKDDSYLLIIAALKCVQEDEELEDTPLPQIDEKDVPVLKLDDIEWFCLDFHTPIGKRALWLYKYKNRDMNENEIMNIWFIGESGLCEGKVRGDWHPKQKYFEERWKAYRPKIKEAVEYIRDKYELHNYKIAVSSGELDKSDSYLENYDLIITTSEKLDSLLRHKVNWINRVKTIIIDEVHLLNDSSRGPTLEVVITLLRQIVPTAQMICLSATVGNAHDLAKWLNAELIKDKWRPVELHKGVYLNGEIEFFT